MQARKFMRYPTDIPISFVMDGMIGQHQHYLKNVGQGGLCFYALGCIEPGIHLNISIPFSDESLSTSGKVAWYRPLDNDQCLLGIAFEKFITQSAIEKIIRMRLC